MKTTTGNEVRGHYIELLKNLPMFADEDVDMITSGSFNLPITWGEGEDEEEGWLEIVVKVPKYDDDEGYALREEYKIKCETRKAKAEEAERQKKAKIEKDKAKRKAKSERKEGGA